MADGKKIKIIKKTNLEEITKQTCLLVGGVLIFSEDRRGNNEFIYNIN